MKKVRLQKSGWNMAAAITGPFWYIYRGMFTKGMLLLTLSLITFGFGVIPIWIYCGLNANSDYYRYIKGRNVYIFRKCVSLLRQPVQRQ